MVQVIPTVKGLASAPKWLDRKLKVSPQRLTNHQTFDVVTANQSASIVNQVLSGDLVYLSLCKRLPLQLPLQECATPLLFLRQQPFITLPDARRGERVMSAHATSPAETRWSFQVTAHRHLYLTIVPTLSDDKTSGTDVATANCASFRHMYRAAGKCRYSRWFES